MFKKYVSLALVGLLLNLIFYSTAMANTEKDAKFAEKVKANIAKLGTGQDAKVEIKLKDGTKLKGYVSEVKDSGFVLTNENTGISNEIPYLQVKQVKGNNLSLGVRIAIGIGVILAIGALLALTALSDELPQ